MRNQHLERATAEAGMTRDGLARACDVSHKTIERWVVQGRVPWPRLQYRAGGVLGVSARDLWPSDEDELVELFPERAAMPRQAWLDLIEGLTETFEMLVYAGLFFHEQHPQLLRALRCKADSGVKIRLLFGDPDHDTVARRGDEERIGDAVPAKVRNTIAVYRSLAGQAGIEARLHTTTLYTSIYRFDNEMLVNPHVYGLPAAQSPLLHLRHTPEGRLFTTYTDCFERIWAGARPAWEPTS